jgi:hypothetical protein
MRERELFLLFIIYSIVPLCVSLLLVLSKLTNWFSFPVHTNDVISNVIQVCAIIVPWVLFFMNSHIYFIKKIQGLGLSRLFFGVTIIQGLFALLSLTLLLSLLFF